MRFRSIILAWKPIARFSLLNLFLSGECLIDDFLCLSWEPGKTLLFLISPIVRDKIRRSKKMTNLAPLQRATVAFALTPDLFFSRSAICSVSLSYRPAGPSSLLQWLNSISTSSIKIPPLRCQKSADEMLFGRRLGASLPNFSISSPTLGEALALLIALYIEWFGSRPI